MFRNKDTRVRWAVCCSLGLLIPAGRVSLAETTGQVSDAPRVAALDSPQKDYFSPTEPLADEPSIADDQLGDFLAEETSSTFLGPTISVADGPGLYIDNAIVGNQFRLRFDVKA